MVFRGTQLALQKPVAIKMLRPDGFHGNDALDRFSREATVVSKLVHPSIAQVLDFGIEDDMPFLVMEFVDGKELTEVTERGTADPSPRRRHHSPAGLGARRSARARHRPSRHQSRTTSA